MLCDAGCGDDIFGLGLALADLANAFIPLQYFMWLWSFSGLNCLPHCLHWWHQMYSFSCIVQKSSAVSWLWKLVLFRRLNTSYVKKVLVGWTMTIQTLFVELWLLKVKYIYKFSVLYTYGLYTYEIQHQVLIGFKGFSKYLHN